MKPKSFFLSFAVVAILALAAVAAGVNVGPSEAVAGVTMASLAAFSTEGTYNQDKLIAANPDLLVSRQITLVSGENRARGALLGRTATAGTVQGAAVAGNGGNGAIGTLSVGGGAKEGVYKVTIIEPATDAGAFIVEDPDGKVVGHGTVAVEFVGPVVFTIADGGNNFVAGDQFNVTVSAVTYKYKLAAAAATDGSAEPRAVLVHDCDASGGDKVTLAFFRGDFNDNALTLGAGHTADSVREGLRAKGITLVKPAVAA